MTLSTLPSGQLTRRAKREATTLSHEVRLVSIASRRGPARRCFRIEAMPRAEVALKPQNAVEGLWAVTKCVFKAPAQGALAKAEFSHKPANDILLWRRRLGEEPVRHRHLWVRQ